MDKAVFVNIRKDLEKTQRELAAMLGVSLKGVQSFEQGWRSIPSHVERQMLFLAAMKACRTQLKQPCWKVKDCPDEMRRTCPAWGFQTRNLCWMVNGLICRGRIQKNWDEKIEFCRNCEMFQSMISRFEDPQERDE